MTVTVGVSPGATLSGRIVELAIGTRLSPTPALVGMSSMGMISRLVGILSPPVLELLPPGTGAAVAWGWGEVDVPGVAAGGEFVGSAARAPLLPGAGLLMGAISERAGAAAAGDEDPGEAEEEPGGVGGREAVMVTNAMEAVTVLLVKLP